MKKTAKKTIIPDITEFTDEEGKRWIQTSTDDLFSIKELNEVLASIDRDSESDEIILARIDFQNVNKEYYETAVKLQKKVQRQAELLKKVIADANSKIERKNRKLKELIDYIKKIHLLLAHLSAGEEGLKGLKVSPEMLMRSLGEPPAETAEHQSVYEEVEETILPLESVVKKIR
jgi:hypothetical protein